MNSNYTNVLNQLAVEIKQIGKELGFDQVGITDTNLVQENTHLKAWVESGYHGDMKYFEKYADIYEHPQKLLADTTRIICCRISYHQSQSPHHPIASFAQTQDYSFLISQLLKEYVDKITHKTKMLQKTRVFAGNAPILEKPLAVKAGLGWYGKNSLLLSEDSGSFFFLGEIFTNIPFPIDKPVSNRCGNCVKCMEHCPTRAIVRPYILDARRCISYLTIENKGSIPLELRPLIGTKIFGCDLCQQICPWNNNRSIVKSKWIQTPIISANAEIHNLIDWFLWDEKEFQNKTKDSPIRRVGHERWLRNIAVALGNSPANNEILEALKIRLKHPSLLVREHVEWALTKVI